MYTFLSLSPTARLAPSTVAVATHPEREVATVGPFSMDSRWQALVASTSERLMGGALFLAPVTKNHAARAPIAELWMVMQQHPLESVAISACVLGLCVAVYMHITA